MSDSLRIVEVGPRDGLQNEKLALPLQEKIWLIQSLVKAGIQEVEVGAFVRPDRVPQMADSDLVCAAIQKGELNLGRAHGWCLVPNRKGLQRALKVGVKRIAVFTAATESFAQRNIGMSIKDSLTEFKEVIREAKEAIGKDLHVRGYISTAFGCPFEGKVSPAKALKVIDQVADLGVDQVSIGDTIGVATPADVEAVVKRALSEHSVKKTAVHFHDTRGTALANTLRSLDLGVRILDSSSGGLGGCPFAPGAAGNLSTEDLVYMLNGMGMKTGIDLEKLCQVSLGLAKKMKRPLSSRYLMTYASQCE